MTRETKQTLMDALSAAGVDFPPSATWTQLKRLFTEHFGTDAGAAPAEDGANLVENNEEVVFADGAFGMHVGAPPQGFAPADAVTNNIVRANTLETDSTATPTVADVTVASDSADFVSTVTAAAANSAAVASAAAAVNSAAAVTHAVNGSSSSISAAACTSAVYKATSADNEELHSLQHRLEILELRQKIRELEGAAVVCNERKLDFADVEHAISKYSGDDVGHAVRSFLCDFEEVMQSINANERLKLLSLRRSLIGTARIFLATTTALNYQELKAALINEFDVAVTRQNIYRVLSQRRWNRKDESLHCYVLTMQSIAKRSDIEETEVIDFIIDGIGNGVANISLLMGAQTVDELKRLINRFQQKYLEKKPTAFVGRNTAATSVKTAVMKQAADTNVIKCFNCSQNGHIKPNCPHPLRPVGSCFRCWQMGHEHRSCTNPKKILKPFADRQIAAVDEVSDENSVNAYNLFQDVITMNASVRLKTCEIELPFTFTTQQQQHQQQVQQHQNHSHHIHQPQLERQQQHQQQHHQQQQHQQQYQLNLQSYVSQSSLSLQQQVSPNPATTRKEKT